MRIPLQNPITALITMASVALALVLTGLPGSSQTPAKLPVIEPITQKPYIEKLTDIVSFEMLPIPGGTYLMGSPKKEPGHKKDEEPQHPVTVKPFWMGKCEVSWDEYDLYWIKRPGSPPPVTIFDKSADAVSRPTPPYADETFGHGRKENPVLCITHHAAMEYCRWLSAKTGKYYRLPTEAEWEWACRAGTTTAFSFGDDPDELGEYGWFAENSKELAQKIGKKKPNPWGLHDMHGNVSEWCVDHYQKDFYSKFPLDMTTLMPVNLPTEKRYSYTVRGGSWLDEPDGCRSAVRLGSEKSWLQRDPQRPQSIWWMTDADFVGFRVVRAVEEQENLKNLKSKVTRESP